MGDTKDLPNDIEKVEYFDVMEFIKNLPIELEDKKRLLLGISAIIVNTAEESCKSSVAACMGLSEDDPTFAAFYNKDIEPATKVDIQQIYNDLAEKCL